MWSVGTTLMWKNYHSDYPYRPRVNLWDDIRSSGFGTQKIYVVQTQPEVVQRCILMTTDPGDLVLDPTCGSGTTAYVAEQWGRRWITIDTSRVALALARARVMGARYPYYVLADSPEGRKKEAELSRTEPALAPTYGSVRQGFVYERVPHITLKAIANNTEIDVIWEDFQQKLEPLRLELNQALGRDWQEWEIPREPGDPWPDKALKAWDRLQAADTDRKRATALKAINAALKRAYTLDDLPEQPYEPWTDRKAIDLHGQWWDLRIARQKEIDASIAAKADYEYLYDKPYEDGKKVRVAGPFTVESQSPHRVLAVDHDDELIDPQKKVPAGSGSQADFVQVIMDNLRKAGVQQAHKEDKINFRVLSPWPGNYIAAEGRYYEHDQETGLEKTGRRVHRPRVRDRLPRRSGRRRPGDRRRRVRPAHCLRLQLHRPLRRLRPPRPHPGAQGPNERRSTHGRRPEEHRQGEPVRHLRRTGHRHP